MALYLTLFAAFVPTIATPCLHSCLCACVCDDFFYITFYYFGVVGDFETFFFVLSCTECVCYSLYTERRLFCRSLRMAWILVTCVVCLFWLLSRFNNARKSENKI